MPGPLKDYWTEFDWEAELKKDDARISTYMQELLRYIDLPSEDAVIMKHIQDKPELVPFGGDYKNSSLAGLFENTDYEEDITFSEEWQKRDGSDFYIVLGRLSKLWAQYFASLGGRGETVGGMRILCFYGKLMARCADIIDMEEELYGIVFCHTRSDVDELAEQLQRHHYSAEAIHGDIPQSQRTKVIANFKDRKFKLLIATDVAARGIDVQDLTHVINYSIPQSHETYIHRIGRTGRAGKSGTAITFVTPGEQRKLSMIRKKVPGEITRRNLPQAWEIVEAKKSRFTALLNTIIGEGKHKQYLSFADSLLTSEHTPPELLAAFLHERFKNELVMDKYINLPANDTFVHPEMHDHSQVYIALGYDAGYNKRKLLDLIFKRSGVGCERLGKVECSGTHTLVNASAGDAERIVKAFQGEKDPETRITGLAVQDDSISEKSSGPLERRSSKRRFSSFRKDSFHGQRGPHKGKKPRYAK